MVNRAGGEHRIKIIVAFNILLLVFLFQSCFTKPVLAGTQEVELLTGVLPTSYNINATPQTTQLPYATDRNDSTYINLGTSYGRYYVKYTLPSTMTVTGYQIRSYRSLQFQLHDDLGNTLLSLSTWSNNTRTAINVQNVKYVYITTRQSSGGDSALLYELYIWGLQVTPPPAPTELTAEVTSYNQAQLTWSAVTDSDLAGYIIYRDYEEIGRVGNAVTSYTDSGLKPNTSYTYGVKAYSTSGLESDISNAAVVTTPLPPAPYGLIISNVTTTGAKATWNAVDGADSYNMYLDGSPVYNTTQTQYGITGLLPGTNHTVEVRTVISSVESNPGESAASFTTPVQPDAPTNLTATPTSYNQVQLNWNAVIDSDLTGYIIYRDYLEIARVGATETSYIDSGLQPNTQYVYGIEAYNTSLIVSDMSNAAIVTTPELNKPIVTARVDNKNINISWVGNADYFLVMLNGQQVYSTTENQYTFEAQPGWYKVQIIAVKGGNQIESDLVNVKVSALSTPGSETMASDLLSNTGTFLFPMGGLLALGLAIKAVPWLITTIKAFL